MKAELRRLHSPDVEEIERFVPADKTSFSLLLQAMIGPAGEPGEESFDILVCTPEWIRQHYASQGKTVVMGRHHLIVLEYKASAIEDEIRRFCDRCEGETWNEVALKLCALGRWEFEDYQP